MLHKTRKTYTTLYLYLTYYELSKQNKKTMNYFMVFHILFKTNYLAFAIAAKGPSIVIVHPAANKSASLEI